MNCHASNGRVRSASSPPIWSTVVASPAPGTRTWRASDRGRLGDALGRLAQGDWERRITPPPQNSDAISVPPREPASAPVVHRHLQSSVLTTALRPRAAAATRPARVRSRIRSRSNWPSAPKTWKISRPPGVVVSICSVARPQADAALLQARHRLQMRKRMPQPVELPDHENVALPKVGERRG